MDSKYIYLETGLSFINKILSCCHDNICVYDCMLNVLHNFKMIDKTDILQTDYPPATESVIKVVAPFEDSCMSLMRSVKINPITMDNFVKRTSTVKEKPDIVPMLRDVNLKSPELRNKGIRKKKNVCPVYADAEQNGEKKNEEEEKEV